MRSQVTDRVTLPSKSLFKNMPHTWGGGVGKSFCKQYPPTKIGGRNEKIQLFVGVQNKKNTAS